MNDIRKMSIWKETPQQERAKGSRLRDDMDVLELSVRSSNCLRRAGCRTVADVMSLAEGEGEALMKIRGLGAQSRQEILQKLEAYRFSPAPEDTGRSGALIRPGRRIWDKPVSDFLPEGEALEELACAGIRQVKDLYRDELPEEPGWFAVRDLFAGIHRTYFKDRYIGHTRLLFREEEAAGPTAD